MTTVHLRTAQLALPHDAANVLRLLEHYSEHPLGAGAPLPASVRAAVLSGLQRHPTTVVFLAEREEVVVGMAICFVGFSTFQAKPLINIHDLVVHANARGQGIGGKLIDAVASYARERAWCAVTLEVRSDNPARRLYARKGFQNLIEPRPQELGQQPSMLFGKMELSSTDHAVS